ncbi:MAG: hypothetical protein M1838_000951 [Thelocarpon superellum]|nr:MAG: hypothetical protein M1838_000951 [Thelocarpon superellum]
MGSIIILGLRALQFLWTLLILALVGSIIHDASGGNPSLINYDMFVAVFSMLSLIYLVAAGVRESLAIHPFLVMVVDLLNTFFFFCAAVAMAAELKVHSCFNNDYLKNNQITAGSSNQTKRCQESQATTAFLWFGFATYLASTVVSAFANGGGSAGLTRGGMGGIRRGAPSMSQV